MAGSNFWVIGGEFGSMNFHKLVEGSAQVQGPFKTRKEAEDPGAWSRKKPATRPACVSPSWKSRTGPRLKYNHCQVCEIRRPLRIFWAGPPVVCRDESASH